MTMLTCKGCDGPIQRNNKYGYCQQTKTCRSRAQMLSDQAHASDHKRQQTAANGLAWDKRNPAKRLLNQLRYRARKQGVLFNLTVDDVQELLDVSECPVFGQPFVKGVGRGGHEALSRSIDRIVPSKGYVRGNTQALSNRANIMKNDATPEELIQFADWVYSTYGRR